MQFVISPITSVWSLFRWTRLRLSGAFVGDCGQGPPLSQGYREVSYLVGRVQSQFDWYLIYSGETAATKDEAAGSVELNVADCVAPETEERAEEVVVNAFEKAWLFHECLEPKIIVSWTESLVCSLISRQMESTCRNFFLSTFALCVYLISKVANSDEWLNYLTSLVHQHTCSSKNCMTTPCIQESVPSSAKVGLANTWRWKL